MFHVEHPFYTLFISRFLKTQYNNLPVLYIQCILLSQITIFKAFFMSKKLRILKQIKYVPPGSIKPYNKNPRINEAAVPEVAKSITEFDMMQPIVVDKKGNVYLLVN